MTQSLGSMDNISQAFTYDLLGRWNRQPATPATPKTSVNQVKKA